MQFFKAIENFTPKALLATTLLAMKCLNAFAQSSSNFTQSSTANIPPISEDASTSPTIIAVAVVVPTVVLCCLAICAYQCYKRFCGPRNNNDYEDLATIATMGAFLTCNNPCGP